MNLLEFVTVNPLFSWVAVVTVFVGLYYLIKAFRGEK